MRHAVALALLLTAGCVAPRQPAPPPPPAPAPAPPPPPAPAPIAEDWRDRAYAPGDWSYARESGTALARYGPLTLACSGAGQMTLSWSGVPAGPVTVRTSYGDTARQGQAGPGGLQLALGARDPLLDQIAFSRGRFMLAAGGQELILPSWPEISRVVEDCRP